MQRRQYLALAGITTATLVAGCSDTGGDGNATSGNGPDTEPATAEPTRTEAMTNKNGETTERTEASAETEAETEAEATEAETEAGASSAANAEISSSEFTVIEGEFSSEAVMTGLIENTSDGRFSYIEATATFYNDGGDVVDTNFTNVAGLGPGQAWSVYIPYLGDASEVCEGELEITDTTTGAAASSPENAELLESNLEEPADEFSGPTVTGRAENTGDSPIDYLEAAVTFYDGEGTVLGSGFTNVTDLPAGETWSFEVEFVSHDPDSSVEDYEVTLADSAF